MPSLQNSDPHPLILTINTGSSSLKAALFRATSPPHLVVSASIDRLGGTGGRMVIRQAGGDDVDEGQILQTHADALRALFDWLEARQFLPALAAIGHRVVHGGRDFTGPALIDDSVIARIEQLVPIDRAHLPQAIACIGAARERLPELPEVACFDTSFHQTMPQVAKTVPLTHDLATGDVRRYGFHGLSYEFVCQELARIDPAAQAKRTIIAHLGNGASMVAVRDGQSIETTMGMTPTGGLVMSTRSGDLDPGVLVHLLEIEKMSPPEINDLVNKHSGMRGISETSGDMRDLLDAEAHDPRAALAVSLFCYSAKKHLGALAAVLGGLDRLVFTGGIGEHAAPVRSRICAGLEFLGIALDDDANREAAAVISIPESRVEVRILPTNEEMMIVRHTIRMLDRQRATIEE